MQIRFQRLQGAGDLPLPSRANSDDAGIDLRASHDAVLPPGSRVLVSTGFVVEIPVGFEGQVRPRSGLAIAYGITVLNAPGTIDCTYRGEVRVILANLGDKLVKIARGNRIAQLVVAPVSMLPIVEVTEVSQTERGAGGFGSTGA